MTDLLRIEQPFPHVVVLTLNRPEKRNALSGALLDALIDAVEALPGEATRACVITGAPPSFCAGGDLREIAAGGEAGLPAYLDRYVRLGRAVRAAGCPLIAAVDGWAVAGGFELACLCDLRVASERAFFRCGDAAIGLPPTSGLTWLLPRLVGLGRARRLLFADPVLDAVEAERIGLVEEVVGSADLMQRSLALAWTIAGWPGQGIALTRAGVERALQTTYEEAVAAEIDAERRGFADPAAQAAIQAFGDRRRGSG